MLHSELVPLVQKALKQEWPTFPLDYTWIVAQVLQESGGNPLATSPVGAQGLLQLMPSTAREMGLVDPRDPFTNLCAGIKYLKIQWDHLSEIRTAGNRYESRLFWSFASYNGGRGYVNRVLLLARLDALAQWWIWSVSCHLFADPRCFVGDPPRRPDHEQILGYIRLISSKQEDLRGKA